MPQGGENGGPDERFTRLTAEFYPRVRRLVSRFARNEEDLDDLTHETFLRIYKKLDTFRGEAALGTWIYKVTFNTCLAWAKERGVEVQRRVQPGASEVDRGAARLEESLGAVEAKQHEAADEKERARAVRQAVAQLPREQGRAMLLYLEDYKRREIARVLRVSDETVKTHLNEARKRLREILGERFDPREPRFEEDDGER